LSNSDASGVNRSFQILCGIVFCFSLRPLPIFSLKFYFKSRWRTAALSQRLAIIREFTMLVAAMASSFEFPQYVVGPLFEVLRKQREQTFLKYRGGN
jgi:hypothetical protein